VNPEFDLSELIFYPPVLLDLPDLSDVSFDVLGLSFDLPVLTLGVPELSFDWPELVSRCEDQG
jgi:hypothetical protein